MEKKISKTKLTKAKANANVEAGIRAANGGLKKEFKKLLDDTLRAAEEYGSKKETKELAAGYLLGALSILKWNKSKLNRFVNKNFLSHLSP
jgi:hypothetical protein